MQLHEYEAEIRAAGAELYVIGNGTPNFIAGFRDTTGFTGTMLTDPSLAVYRAAELRRGLRTFVSLGAAARTVGALARGFRQGRTQGDALQQGGVLVIARDGRVLWQHISESPGDNADPEQIVRVLRAA
ncbi:MAG TPA: peroxiredoxin-like family protein [Kofleriaceae bacterium]|nr:peroxiredoxin-like family protein [Kofleriaceae bacterium]